MEALPAVEVPDLDAGVRRAGDDPVLGADDLALLLLAPHPLVVVDLVLALKERETQRKMSNPFGPLCFCFRRTEKSALTSSGSTSRCSSSSSSSGRKISE